MRSGREPHDLLGTEEYLRLTDLPCAHGDNVHGHRDVHEVAASYDERVGTRDGAVLFLDANGDTMFNAPHVRNLGGASKRIVLRREGRRRLRGIGSHLKQLSDENWVPHRNQTRRTFVNTLRRKTISP